MRFTNKIKHLISFVLIFCLVFSFTACGKSVDGNSDAAIQNVENIDANSEENNEVSEEVKSDSSKAKDKLATYDIYSSSYKYGILKSAKTTEDVGFFSDNICVTGAEDIGTADVDSQVASAAGLFNVTTGQVKYAQNIYAPIYPASTTKILTCLVALENGDLNQQIVVSAEAAKKISSDSSVCGFSAGDTVSLETLLYGLMLCSGNDAAVAIAEGIAGSTDNFAAMMNQRAASVGATQSHFVTANGLHDDNHYTTVYDMYLIFNEAIKNENFLKICGTKNIDVTYMTANGSAKTVSWKNTNQYFTGQKHPPKGFNILGGKTGSTGPAGYCLVILSENPAGEKLISLVYNADCRYNVYYLTNEITYLFGQ